MEDLSAARALRRRASLSDRSAARRALLEHLSERELARSTPPKQNSTSDAERAPLVPIAAAPPRETAAATRAAMANALRAADEQSLRHEKL